NSLEGGPKARPSKSSGNPTSGVYDNHNITFARETPQPDFFASLARRRPSDSLALQNLPDRPPSLIDRHIRIRIRPGIRICNRNFPKRLPPHHPRFLFLFPFRI